MLHCLFCWSRLVLIVSAVLVGLSTAGCSMPRFAIRSTPGPLTVRPLSGNSESFKAQLPNAQFAFIDDDTVKVLMLEGPPDKPERVAVLSVYWRPRGGLTPVDPNATNALMKYVDLRGEEPVILSGAGFVYPLNKLDSKKISLDIWQMDLMPESTTPEEAVTINHAGKIDPNLVIYRASGRISAQREDRRTLRQIEIVKQALIDAGL